MAAVPVGLLATALLVINNLRDIPGDTESGKRTLAVRLGDRRTRGLYVGLLVVAFLLRAGRGRRASTAARPPPRWSAWCWPAGRWSRVLEGARGPS